MHDIQQATLAALGLLLYMLLSVHGPAGDLRLLLTPSAMIIGQFLLCLPLMVALAHAAFRAGDQRAWESALTLGAHPWRALITVIYELRFGLLAAILAGFGRGRHVYLHQTPYMFDTTVEQNIAYGLRVRGQSPAARQAEVRAALAWAGLDALATRPARELSLGEQQRVALTRAYVLAPSTLLLDEITANLDGDHRRQVHDMLLALRERATCVVFATHDPAPLLSRVDSHLHLDAGRLALPTRSDVQIIPLRREGGRPERPSRS